MKYYVYLIKRKSRTGKITYYTGYSRRPQIRWAEHHERGSNKGYYLEGMAVVFSNFPSRASAMKREKEVKGYTHKMKAMLYEAVKGLGDGFFSYQKFTLSK